MSRPRAYSQDSLDIQERFFSALDFLVNEGKMKNVYTFCRIAGIDARNFIAQKTNNTRGFFQVGWLVPLVNYYYISPRWLLTGKGKMTTSHYG